MNLEDVDELFEAFNDAGIALGSMRGGRRSSGAS